MMCLPFWWGVVLSLVFYSPTFATGEISDINLFLFTIPAKGLAIFLDGALTSGLIWILHTAQEALERHHSDE